MVKLEIKTHQGDVYVEEVENYDPHELNTQINNNEILTVLIGKLIISRIKIAEITVVSE